ncbi:AAA family ATPase [Labrys wisconsinensis]|uniref:MoxR-like ATPase n=1 Tax=Labrys wisconsinensis TaxID=425677 RepID=A0ABU0J5L9_9HYPH|nr:MoxR family ATPase [Labrys wisconsinensis]MDQ0468945.1 MoxR-like ATPase [Labrys wisconsinensis]
MWFNSFPRDGGDRAEIEENGRIVADKGRDYVFTEELMAAIDVAIGLGRPLLVSGEPGCGKTELGYAIARCMGIGRVHFFSTKSNSEARDLFYSYDAIGRFRDAQATRDPAAPAPDIADYVEYQALGRAILDAHEEASIRHLLRGSRPYSHPGRPRRSVVILDEIDKASRDFPNDLLREIEDLSFRVPELARREGDAAEPETPGGIAPDLRPIVVVTSNEERQLPDAFLRRCVFHEIAFPEGDILGRIIASGLRKRLPPGGGDAFTLPDDDRAMLLRLLEEFRGMQLDKRPGISETIDAATLLAYPSRSAPPPLERRLPAIVAALAKLKSDRTILTDLIQRQV